VISTDSNLGNHERKILKDNNAKTIYLEKNFSSNRPTSASSSLCSSYSSASSSPCSSQTSFVQSNSHLNNNQNIHDSIMPVSDNNKFSECSLVILTKNDSSTKIFNNLIPSLGVNNSLKNSLDNVNNFSSLASVTATALNNSMVFKSSIRAKKVKFRLKLFPQFLLPIFFRINLQFFCLLEDSVLRTRDKVNRTKKKLQHRFFSLGVLCCEIFTVSYINN